jgi:hypothetical protein
LPLSALEPRLAADAEESLARVPRTAGPKGLEARVDHAVINVLQQMDAAVARFRALGFTVTDRSHHSLGSINHLMVFDRDYLELVGVEAHATKIRREVAEAPPGLNGLVFRTESALRLHDELAGAGIPVQDPLRFERDVMIEGKTQQARFATVRVAPGHLSGGRVYFCEHETPHLVWQPRWQRHANSALGLASFTVVVPAPTEESRRYEQLLGCEARSEDGGMALTLGHVRLLLCTLEDYQQRYGKAGCGASRSAAGGTLPLRAAFMGALSIRTGALAAVQDCLEKPEAADVQWHRDADRVIVSAASAFDCVIEFVEIESQ